VRRRGKEGKRAGDAPSHNAKLGGDLPLGRGSGTVVRRGGRARVAKVAAQARAARRGAAASMGSRGGGRRLKYRGGYGASTCRPEARGKAGHSRTQA
jgi:hypothetical protein